MNLDLPFYFYFGLLGLVVGGTVTWLVLTGRPFETKEEPWRPADPLEAGFLASEMAERGRPLDEATVAELLELHLAYLEGRIREEQARAETERIEAARAAARRRATAADPDGDRGVTTPPAYDTDLPPASVDAHGASAGADMPKAGRPGTRSSGSDPDTQAPARS